MKPDIRHSPSGLAEPMQVGERIERNNMRTNLEVLISFDHAAERESRAVSSEAVREAKAESESDLIAQPGPMSCRSPLVASIPVS